MEWYAHCTLVRRIALGLFVSGSFRFLFFIRENLHVHPLFSSLAVSSPSRSDIFLRFPLAFRFVSVVFRPLRRLPPSKTLRFDPISSISGLPHQVDPFGGFRMPVYEEDEYEDYDEYEEEEEEGEEEEEHEQMPTKESKEYLEFRERLKQRIRKGLHKGSGSGVSKSLETKKKSSDNYGSFFGPSQPVIAPRVIQESKSLLENPHLLFKTPNPLNNKKTSSSNGTVPKNGKHEQIPKVRHELQSKVQKIKDTRDYSFLLDDNAKLPAAPVSQNVSVSRSAAGTAPMPQKSRPPAGNSARDIRNGREEGKAIPRNGHMHSKPEPHKSLSMSRHSSTSADSRGKLQKTSITGPGRPLPSMDSRRQLQSKNASGPGRPLESMDSRRQSQSNNGSGHVRPGSGHVRPGNGHVRPEVSTDRRQLQSNGHGPVRPMGGPKHGSSQAPLTNGEKKAYPPVRKAILPPERKRLPSNTQSSIPKHEVERKRSLQSIPKHSVASSKTQISKPVKQLSSRPSIQDTRLKRKPSRSFDEESEKALRLIREMTGSDRYRNRYNDEDDDLSDMEANFDEIQEEEYRSARIAKKEDEEEARLIEQEEREERMRKQAKKRKLNNHR
ncbi:SPT2 chromatin protein [Euphorbia peplus]|nr:SPT2 chromatin protein [Euphorbia peplus]